MTIPMQGRLVFPAYLDVPMMVSFLATLEGGVRFEDQVTIHQRDSSGKEQEVKARVGLPSVLSLLNLSASGRISARDGEEASQEVSMVKRHTEASLFNVLLRRLDELDVVRAVTDAGVLEELRAGDFVEVSGEILENPFKRLISLLVSIAPLLGIDIQQLLKKGPPSGGGKSKAGVQLDTDALEGIRQVLMLAVDMYDSLVEDLVLDAPLKVVVTADQQFLAEGSLQRLLGCEYTVLGKVTRVLDESSKPINLTRRSTLGLLPADQVAELLSAAEDAMQEEFDAPLGRPILTGPALQILPLAMYV